MGVLSNLEPKEVFHYFEEICGIPHPSYKEEKISNYLVSFAKERGLEYYQDDLKNVIIIKEASAGYEEAAPIIIQGHMDMVCEKVPGCKIDFEHDGLKLKIEGDYVTADGTTLGGDDGIAVAYALAILASEEMEHPRIEFVCTVSEEVGMEGAAGIDVSMLQGKKLLNLDSEEEGIMLISCAGGCRAECKLPAEWEKVEGQQIAIHVKGLIGGHSGVEIHKGRANSNMLLGRVLLAAGGVQSYHLMSCEGGNKDNVIPRETNAVVVVKENADAFIQAVEKAGEEIAAEYAAVDPDISVTAERIGAGVKKALSEGATTRAAALMHALPNGIQRMSTDIEGLVETSLNLGVLRLTEESFELRYALRSSVGTALKYLCAKMRMIAEQLGAELAVGSEYPAWEYKRDSKLREDMAEVYRKMYGTEMKIEAIHAGLECGILSGKIPGLDAVSIGPDMVAVHTAEEKLSISSTKRTWEFLSEVIKCR